MSGPYEQQGLSQAPGYYPGQVAGQTPTFYPGQVAGQAPGYFPGQVAGQAPGYYPGQAAVPNIAQQTAFGATDVSHGEHAKKSGSSSSSGSYVAENKGHISYGGAGVAPVGPPGVTATTYHGGYVGGGSYETAYGGARRHGRYRRQVIQLPDPIHGSVRQVRHRLLTPEPDTLERVYIQRTGPEIIEEITEVPTTPPPRIQERTVVEPAGPPQVVRKVIRVPPRSGGYTSYPQYEGASFYTGGQGISNLASSGSFANLQPSFGGFSNFGNFGGLSLGGGFAGGATNFGGFGSLGGFGSFGSGFQHQNFGLGGFQSQGLLPTAGFPGANCFFI
ncbi:unnamed protein product [Rotaria sp. Silwood1]|nr:unnamed protein product [Rotaria sp. Silwood1]CAF3410241.1 unnamed protein product [Rotaria sp. Silwood1]CAF4785239.1 unnamed protein product [Rotaria sp. Silwood1]